jgi:hypothetical protein
MAYVAVIVCVDLDADTDGRVRLATGLADRFKATLIGPCRLHPPTRPSFAEEASQRRISDVTNYLPASYPPRELPNG